MRQRVRKRIGTGEAAADHRDGGFNRPCEKVERSQADIWNSRTKAEVQGHWGDDGSQGSIRSWNFKVQRGVGISKLLPFRPVASRWTQPERGTPAQGIPRLWPGVGKQFWVKVGLVPPEGPQGLEDFALGV